MQREPNHDDANLILKLYELRREEKLRKARAWFVSECKPANLAAWEELCPPGSEPNAFYRMVTTYWDMAASFVTTGVLHPELFIQDSLEMLVVWTRIRHLVPDIRRKFNAPHQLRNLEGAAALAADWLNQQGPGVLAAFEERFKAPTA
jgi:hypothetical protein